MPASRQPTASRFLGSVVRGFVPLLQLTRRPLRDIVLQPCASCCDDIPLSFFHGVALGSVAASLRSATAAAGAPAGAQEDDEREEDLGDALRSRLVAWQRRRRSFCRSRFPSLTISFLTSAGTFCQSPGFNQYRGRDEALWL